MFSSWVKLLKDCLVLEDLFETRIVLDISIQVIMDIALSNIHNAQILTGKLFKDMNIRFT